MIECCLVAVQGLVVMKGGRAILDVPHLCLRTGEILAVIGPNGAGKSTLLQAMALLERPSRGQVLFAGVPAAGRELQLRRRIAVAFQEPLLLDASVEYNVTLGLKMRGVSRKERRQRALAWLERFGIAHLAHRSARSLSGGEAQRVNLARAFALEPEALFLDEPFAGLDQVSREALIDDLQRVLHETGTATLLVTHDRAEALQLGHRVAVMIDGRLRQVGTAADVFNAPVDSDVASFVGMENILAGCVVGVREGIATVQVGQSTIETVVSGHPQGEVLACVRPEDITLASPAALDCPTATHNRLRGTVQVVKPAGPNVRVVVDCGVPLAALITRRSSEELSLTPGAQVAALIEADRVHLIYRS